MFIPCDACGAQNPEGNRFCGQCGSRLTAAPVESATEAPEEFWRGGLAKPHEPLEASADLPPEAIEFDNQVPLFAGEGGDRRLHPAPELVNEAHEHLEREARMHDRLEHGDEPHYEVRAREDALKDLNFAQTAHQHLGISGPSFLGLTDTDDEEDTEYLLQELNPPSHMRRNIALVVLVGAAALAALQWRSVRDYGLAYMQNGAMHVTPHAQDAQRNPPEVAADNTDRDLGLASGAAKAGAAKPVESSPNADLTAQSQPPFGPQPQAATPTPPTTTAPGAMSAPPPDVPQSRVAPANEAPAKAPVTKAAKTSRHLTAKQERAARRVQAAKQKAGREVGGPGTDELRRASNASDAEARAAWLWRAVKKGNPQASVELAGMYEHGAGVVRNCDQAQLLLQSAAAKGNPQARANLQQIRARGGCATR